MWVNCTWKERAGAAQLKSRLAQRFVILVGHKEEIVCALPGGTDILTLPSSDIAPESFVEWSTYVPWIACKSTDCILQAGCVSYVFQFLVAHQARLQLLLHLRPCQGAPPWLHSIDNHSFARVWCLFGRSWKWTKTKSKVGIWMQWSIFQVTKIYSVLRGAIVSCPVPEERALKLSYLFAISSVNFQVFEQIQSNK